LRYRGVLLALIAICAFAARTPAADNTELMAAYSQMESPVLDESQAFAVTGLTIEQRDFKLQLDSGIFCFFTPLRIDSTPRSYGGVFLGKGSLIFTPPVRMEKEQLQRFFKSDSLNRPIDKAIVLCDARTVDMIRTSGQAESRPEIGKLDGVIGNLQKYLTMRQEHYYLFEALRNIAFPRRQGYLLVNTEPQLTSPVFYIFDPYEREEVQFRRHYKEFVVPLYMELICSYSVYSDETYAMINGMDKNEISLDHYGIDATVDRGGDFSAASTVDFTVQMTPTQMITWGLHERLTVDSIRDSAGRNVSFLRYTDKDYRSTELHLILPQAMANGERGSLTFYYHGDIIKKQVGDFVVDARNQWYPRYSWSDMAPYDVTFHTSADYEFVFSGDLVSREKVKNSLVTTWTEDRPVRSTSFNIGNFKRYEFSDRDAAPVLLYYNEDLHRATADAGRNMPERVADDIIGSQRLFNAYFGKMHWKTMTVSELLNVRGESYPGYVHLDPTTFQSSDLWGRDQCFRAHEVAHQWWGTGVGPATYHDTWLSEGFAEYSGLMYLQAAMGNDQFMYWLNEYRKNIATLHKFLFSDREQAGPMALGYRTSTTKSIDDYDLIVYEKGAYVMHMLRNLLLDLQTMKEDRFLNMMRDFYATYDGKLVTTQDFKAAVEKHVGEDMTWFFDEWVNRSEIPTYEFSYTVSPRPDKGYDIRFSIEQKDVPETFKMYVPIEIESDAGSRVYVRVLVDRPLVEDTVSVLAKPKKVRLNPFESVLANVHQ
jgi:hypothetical protein